jgi:hypothetical protein
VFHDRQKYIEIKHYILHDEVHKRDVVLQYISTDEQITYIFGKSSIQDEKVCVLKREEITPRLGGSTDVLLIYGQSFFNLKNSPG